MSVRPQRTFRFRRRFRRAALWLGLAAAFLPTFFPSLHAGHGFPVAPPSNAADGAYSHRSAHSHHAHPAQHVSLTGERDERRGDTPAAPDHRPTNGVCPICRTLQQIGAVVVPEIATVVERRAAGGDPVATPSVFIAFAVPFNPTQPRAPPVDA
jgi:hypothetical protein